MWTASWTIIWLLMVVGDYQVLSASSAQGGRPRRSNDETVPVVQQPEQRWIKPSPKALRLGDPCSNDSDCSILTHSQCDFNKGVCVCTKEYPVDGGHLCGQGRGLNESCSFHAECVESDRNLQCQDSVCQCTSGFLPAHYTGGNIVCTSLTKPDGVGSFVDPTMIGVLIGLILMFVIMCVVLRLFSKARWRENRTIFNTPNPRLANASLLKEVTKQSVGQPPGSRRGSLTMRNGGSSSLASIPRSLNNDVSGPGGHSSVPRHVTAGTSTTEDAGGRREGAGSAEHEKLLGEHLQHHHHHHHHHQISVQVDQTGL